MISQATIERILEAAPIEAVIGEYVTLKRRGANYVACCPFHNEKTPSFSVSPSKGIFKCFGCGKAGNVIRFVMEHDQLTYVEALRFLGNKYNIPVEKKRKNHPGKPNPAFAGTACWWLTHMPGISIHDTCGKKPQDAMPG
jgi:DNA primase